MANSIDLTKSQIFPVFPTMIVSGGETPTQDMIDWAYAEKNAATHNGNPFETGRGTFQTEPASHPKCLEHVIQKASDILNDICRCSFTHLPGWVTINPPNSSQSKHTHPGVEFACIYYIQCDENTGAIQLDHPDRHNAHSYIASLKPEVVQTSGCGSYFDIQPAPGNLLVLPAYLPHQVLTNNSTMDRISYAWSVETNWAVR